MEKSFLNSLSEESDGEDFKVDIENIDYYIDEENEDSEENDSEENDSDECSDGVEKINKKDIKLLLEDADGYDASSFNFQCKFELPHIPNVDNDDSCWFKEREDAYRERLASLEAGGVIIDKDNDMKNKNHDKDEADNKENKKNEVVNKDDKKNEVHNEENKKNEVVNKDDKKNEVHNEEDKKDEVHNEEDKKNEDHKKNKVINKEDKKNEVHNKEDKKNEVINKEDKKNKDDKKNEVQNEEDKKKELFYKKDEVHNKEDKKKDVFYKEDKKNGAVNKNNEHKAILGNERLLKEKNNNIVNDDEIDERAKDLNKEYSDTIVVPGKIINNTADNKSGREYLNNNKENQFTVGKVKTVISASLSSEDKSISETLPPPQLKSMNTRKKLVKTTVPVSPNLHTKRRAQERQKLNNNNNSGSNTCVSQQSHGRVAPAVKYIPWK